MTNALAPIGQLTIFDIGQGSSSGKTAASKTANVGSIPTPCATFEKVADAVKRASDHANPDWKEYALRVVHDLAERYEEFTTDAAWEILDRTNYRTPQPRALGALMLEAKRKGWIEQTHNYVNSKRPECHSRPVRLWRSRICSPHGI